MGLVGWPIVFYYTSRWIHCVNESSIRLPLPFNLGVPCKGLQKNLDGQDDCFHLLWPFVCRLQFLSFLESRCFDGSCGFGSCFI